MKQERKRNSESYIISTMIILEIYNHEYVNPILYKGTAFHDMKLLKCITKMHVCIYTNEDTRSHVDT